MLQGSAGKWISLQGEIWEDTGLATRSLGLQHVLKGYNLPIQQHLKALGRSGLLAVNFAGPHLSTSSLLLLFLVSG